MLGALLGVHAGDSLGAGFEFQSPAAIAEQFPDGITEIVGGGVFEWPAGAATDDTDLTKAVLDAHLLRPDDPVEAAADNMLAWFDAGPVDIGSTTIQGLSNYRATRDPSTSGAGSGAAGNGSLMRCISTAIMPTDPATRRRHTALISAITHDDPRCIDACVAHNEIVAQILAGSTPMDAIVSTLSTPELELNGEATDAIRVGMEGARSGALARATPSAPPPTVRGPYSGSGFVLDALSIAVAAVLDPRPLPDILSDVVMLGGDTDTNAAIAGGLLGVRDGVEAIPARWRSILQFAPEFEAAVDQIVGV